MKIGAARLVVAVCVMVSGRQVLFAGGEGVNVRGMGMAGTFVATSRGLDAVDINPANLAMKDDDFTLSLAPFGVHVGSDFMTYGTYNKYFTGIETGSGRVATYLDESAKQDILNSFGGVGHITADVSARLIGISFQLESIGGFAFTVSDQLSADISVPRQYLEFALYGNDPGSNYDFNGTRARASWLREYAVSFGGTIPHPGFLDWTSFGASVKVVQGFGSYEFGQFNTSLATSADGVLTGHVSYVSTVAGKDPNTNKFTFGVFGMPVAGHGTGFDIGLAGGTREGLTFGISIVDIGKVNWEGNIQETTADTTLVVDDPREVQDGNAITNSLKGKTKSADPYSTSLPTTLRAGVAIQVDKMLEWVPGQLLLAVDVNQGLVDVPGTTTQGRISTGIEWKLLKFLPLRTGISFGGTDRLNYALGFGLNLGFFDLDVATENIELLWSPDNLSHASIAAGTRFRF